MKKVKTETKKVNVDFIWLQPSQKYGSIRNRIEI